MQDSQDRHALRHGLIAVAAFAATLPLTRIALEGFALMPLTFGRLLGAAVPAFLLLNVVKAPLPKRHHQGGLVRVALAMVVTTAGFARKRASQTLETAQETH